VLPLRFPSGRALTDGFAYPSALSFGPGQPCAGQSGSGGVPPSLITCATGHGMSTVQPSRIPFGFRLGPTNLPRTNLPEETLGFRRTGFSPVFSLLIPAFSLPPRPPLLTVWLLPTTERSPTPQLAVTPTAAHASVPCMSPLTLSAQDHIRPVSCYALFQWWLLLSQHPGCLRAPTSFYT
jgi:hypothetical protein